MATEEDAERLAKRWSGSTTSVPLDSGVSPDCMGDSGEYYTGEEEVLSTAQPEASRYVLVTGPETTGCHVSMSAPKYQRSMFWIVL